jgi:hypothetical protein
MSDPISFVTPGAIPASLPTTQQAPAPVQRTFAETLQQTPAPATPPTPSETQPLADAYRLSLEQELRRNPLPPGSLTQQTLLEELNRTRSPISYLRDAVGGLSKTPQGTDLQGLLNTVETEWFDLEKALKTVNEFTSSGQLLGLQARLYKVAQHIEVMSKVVDQTTGGLKTIINTNV